MASNRPYSVDEVVRILGASEHRPRPDKPAGKAEKGHAIALHTLERKNVFSRPGKLPSKDSLFQVDRTALAALVHEVLNSAPGQARLADMNSPNCASVAIRSVILRMGNGFDIFTVYRPKAKDSQTSFDWLSTTSGDGFIVQVFVLVVKLPGSSEDIHIQTAFPEDYARTASDDIVRRST